MQSSPQAFFLSFLRLPSFSKVSPVSLPPFSAYSLDWNGAIWGSCAFFVIQRKACVFEMAVISIFPTA